MALAAALVLIPAAHAQDPNHEAYEFNEQKGIGYNKYLVSNTPDADGNYMLRIENFITGKVKATSTPTDFILVLDVSGSMHFDFRPRGTTVPRYIRKADNDNRAENHALKLKLADGEGQGRNRYRFVGIVTGGNVGAAGSGGYDSQTWAQNVNTPGSAAPTTTRWYYYPEDETYYRLYRFSENIDGQQCYYIYFDRVNSAGETIERRYVVQDGNDIATTTVKPTNIHGEKIIIFIDNLNNSGYKLYCFTSRREALMKGVNSFIDLIQEENEKDQWDSGVTKHQVAVIAFGNNTNITNMNEPAAGDDVDGNSKVVRIFREITAENADSYKHWDNKVSWQGSTYIYRGITGARRMFENLQSQPNMAPLNASGGTNRAKVLVVFTDGEPTQPSGFSGYSGVRGSINLSCADGAVIKQTGKDADDNQYINGLIYTINLSTDNTYVPGFLEHLSSNYKVGTVSNGTTGGGAGTTYNGEKTGDGYYMDANEIDLESAFEAIAAANTGALSTTLVAVDKVSDSFMLPFTTEDVDKVTMYTAQCIGTKEITVNGVTKEYLAFAEPIKVDERRGLRSLWVLRENSTTHEMEWRDAAEGGRFDIDDDITFQVTEDGKSIIVGGFNYADLWCGQDLYHDNERQTVATTDPNYDYQVDGYRGFKIIFEFPIHVDPDALGGVHVPTNDPSSGLYKAGEDGMPTSMEVQYPEPDLPVPIKLIVKKAGLKAGESANFTVQRKLIGDDTAVYEDVLTFVLTGGVSIPEIRIPNLDPAYYYKIKEEDWSWAYENISKEYYTTDPNDNPAPRNPITFENNPIPDTPKHAEAKADNKMRKTSEGTSTAEFYN